MDTTIENQPSSIEQLRQSRHERAMKIYRKMLAGEAVALDEQDESLITLNISIKQYHADKADFQKIAELQSQLADNENRQTAAQASLKKARERLAELRPAIEEGGQLQRFIFEQENSWMSLQDQAGTMRADLDKSKRDAARFLEP